MDRGGLPPSRFSGVVLVCCFPRERERERGRGRNFPPPLISLRCCCSLRPCLLLLTYISRFSLALSPGLLCAHIRVCAHSGEERERESASVGGCSYFPFLPQREKKTEEEEEVRTKRQLQPYNKSGKGRRRLWGQKQEGKRKGFKLGGKAFPKFPFRRLWFRVPLFSRKAFFPFFSERT